MFKINEGHALLREWSLIFYGTTQAIHPNDPTSTPRTALVDITTPNSSSTNSNFHQFYSAQYPRITNNLNFSKFGSPGKFSSSLKIPLNKSVYIAASSDLRNDPLFKAINNQGPSSRKQQQQQSSKTGTSLYSSNPKNTKLNKNNKGKSQENNKSNTNANNDGRMTKQKDSSMHTPTGSQKSKFYRISQQNKSTNNLKTQSPPEVEKQKLNKLQQSTERLKILEDKAGPGRKVIGDLQPSSSMGNNNGKFNLKLPTTTSKFPVKSIKQVKESYSTKQPSLTTDILTVNRVASTALQPNQRITKLFERYEKIQSIFPEFQPYQPILKDKHGYTAGSKKILNQSQMQAKSNASLENEKSNAKQRENTKKSSQSFVPDKRILKKQQLLLAAAGVDSTQRPMSLVVPVSHSKDSNGTDNKQYL